MSSRSIPPEVQQLIVQYQSMREHYIRIDAELKIVEAELADIDTVMSAIKDLPDDAEIFKAVGHILVKKTKSEIVKELDERKELLTLRKDKYKKQLEFLTKQISELEARIKEALQKHGITVG